MIRTIVEVERFEARDGRQFETPAECQRHELRLIMDRDGVCRGGEWSDVMIRDWILDNADEIAALLEVPL